MSRKRYTSVAISLHWLIAIVLIGLVAIGKYMNELEQTDSFRFELIQWHKSFGILALLLIVLRILWRFSHRPPRLSSRMPAWERFAASATHLFMYLLMLVIPLSGWIMVSASPLNLKTELFDFIPWPHIPLGLTVEQKEPVTELAIQAHHLLANGLLILVLLHIAAALRHQFVLRDNLMARMWMSIEHHRHNDQNHALIPGLLLAGAVGVYLWNLASTTPVFNISDTSATVVVDSRVGFTATQLGEPVEGIFEGIELLLALDRENPALSTLSARVQTASVNTGDGQIDSTVVTADWFASDQYPEASFTSTGFDAGASGAGDTETYTVSGNLTIRGVSQQLDFPLQVIDDRAFGEFTINRVDFEIGTSGQDEFIEPEVTVRFETPI